MTVLERQNISSLIDSLGFSPPPFRPEYENRRTDYGIASIGLHWIAQCACLPAYRSARLNLVGAAEIDPDRIATAVNKGYPQERIISDWGDLVRRPDVEIVDCCFGHRGNGLGRRRQVIEAAAASRKHVLIQKPVAHTVAVAEEFSRLAESSGIWLAVNQNCRYNPANYSIKQLLTTERMGRPRLIEVRQYWGAGANLPPAERAHATIDHMIHHADLIRWWVGEPCVSVSARSLHSTTVATYEFADGTVAHHTECHSGERANLHVNEIRVMTERGVIKGGHNWNWHVPSARGLDFVRVVRAGGDAVDLPLPEHIYEPPWHEVNPWDKRRGPYYDLGAPVAGFLGSMGALMHAVETGRIPDNHISTAIESLRMCLAAHWSAKTGRPVDPREIPPDLGPEGVMSR